MLKDVSRRECLMGATEVLGTVDDAAADEVEPSTNCTGGGSGHLQGKETGLRLPQR